MKITRSTRRSLVLVMAIHVGLTVGFAQATPITTNLEAWFKAKHGVVVDGGGGVVQWSDLSGNNNHAYQTAPANRPTFVDGAFNNQSSIHFDSGRLDYLTLSNAKLDLTSGLAVFIVARNQGSASNGLLRIGPSTEVTPGSPFLSSSELEFYGATASPTTASVGGTHDRDMFFGGSGTYDARGFGTYALATNSVYIVDMTSGPTPVFAPLRLNGAVVDNGFPTWAPSGAGWATLGVGFGGFGEALYGDIAEILIYNANLTESDRDAVYSYLYTTYFLPEPAAGVLLGFGLMLASRRSGNRSA